MYESFRLFWPSEEMSWQQKRMVLGIIFCICKYSQTTRLAWVALHSTRGVLRALEKIIDGTLRIGQVRTINFDGFLNVFICQLKNGSSSSQYCFCRWRHLQNIKAISRLLASLLVCIWMKHKIDIPCYIHWCVVRVENENLKFLTLETHLQFGSGQFFFKVCKRGCWNMTRPTAKRGWKKPHIMA